MRRPCLHHRVRHCTRQTAAREGLLVTGSGHTNRVSEPDCANAWVKEHYRRRLFLCRPGHSICTRSSVLCGWNQISTALEGLVKTMCGSSQRNAVRRASGTPLPLPSFSEWFAGGDRRAEWRLGWYSEEVTAPRDAVKAFEEKTGTRKFAEFRSCSGPDDLKKGVFTLGFLGKSRGRWNQTQRN